MPEEVFETPQTVEPTAETKPTNWPKIVLATVLGLGLLATAAYAGYWYGTESSKFKSQSAKPQPKTQNQEETTPSPAPTTEWKSYVNTFDQYSIRYPAAWYLSPSALKGQAISLSSYNPDDPVRNPQDTSILNYEAKIDIMWVGSKKSAESLLDYLNRMKSSYIGGPEETNPYARIFTEFPYAGSVGYRSQEEDAIFISHKNDVFLINTPSSSHPYAKTVDQILSTFKFLD